MSIFSCAVRPPRVTAAQRVALLLAFFSSVAAAAESDAPRMLEPRRLHLGVAGMPEWDEFAATPHGRQLELTFSANANLQESTLLVWQREVRTTWNVILNGQKLGVLETLTQPLVRAFAIPARLLHSGENRLLVTRLPSPVLDDIEVGEISLVSAPRSAWLKSATIDVAVTASETHAPLPSRLTLVGPDGALVPLHVSEDQRLAVRTGVVYTRDGRARIGVAPGTYTLYAGRGFEYGIAEAKFSVRAGETRTVELSLTREVPTPGWIACDTHIHTLTFSKHGDATLDERMLTIAGEGIELAVATDHNHHADYRAARASNGVAAHFTPVVGNEVTTAVGHFNAFPVSPDGPVPDASLTDWSALLKNVRSVTGAKVITLNHPRDVHQKFTPFGPENFDATTGELKRVPEFACDGIEVVTSAALQSDVMLLYRDWFALLNRGYRLAALGASDTHQVSEFILGQARTYVASRASDVGAIDVNEACESFLRGRLLVSMGLLTTMTVDERFSVGDLATGLGDSLAIEVAVFGPSWVTADRVELFANGLKVREQAIAAGAAPEKARVRWTLPRPRHDVHLVAVATGPGVTAPYWEIARPYQPSTKAFTPRVVGSTNPIWIDADGDGRFTPARGYAVRAVTAAAGDAAALQRLLADFDEAVAVQARDLSRAPDAPR